MTDEVTVRRDDLALALDKDKVLRAVQARKWGPGAPAGSYWAGHDRALDDLLRALEEPSFRAALVAEVEALRNIQADRFHWENVARDVERGRDALRAERDALTARIEALCDDPDASFVPDDQDYASNEWRVVPVRSIRAALSPQEGT